MQKFAGVQMRVSGYNLHDKLSGWAGLKCKNRDKLIGYTSCLLQLYYFHNVGVCTKPGLLIVEERLFDSRRDRGTILIDG